MTAPTTPPPAVSPAAPWHVLGAGAIGGLWALRLAARGLPVTLLARDKDPSTRTLTLHDGERRQQLTLPQHSPQTAAAIAQLLIATKAHLTEEALPPFLPALAQGATVLLLQNGMGVDTWLHSLRSDLHVLTAITTDGVYRRDRDTLVQAGRGETRLGALQAADMEHAAATARELGMQFAPDILHRRWHKLAINCAINPLTARYRCRNGELLRHPAALATMQAVCEEVAQVMRAEGLAADAETLFAQACATAAQTAANVSSMHADVAAGRGTEIRFLNGYIVACAQWRGIAAPMNAALVAEITALPGH